MHEIPPHVAKKLFHFPEAEREKILDELNPFPLNQNNLADILDLLSEISRRDRVSAITILLDGMGGTKGLTDPFKKIDALKEFLKQKRFPLYQHKKNRFEEALKKLRLPATVSMTSSPFFEESFVEIKVRVSSKRDLKKLIEVLKAPAWTEIFEVIK